MKKIYFLLLVFIAFFVACKKDMDVEFTTFSIKNEQFIPSYRTLEMSCMVRCEATINELYLQYDTVADFSTYQEVQLEENEKTKVYSAKIGDLQDNTTYYVRYLAVNSYSSVLSEEISEFKTLQATTPMIVLREITDVLDSTATVSFVLNFDGGADITKIGVCWSIDSVPTLDSAHVVCDIDAEKGIADGDSLALNISGLEANTTYYIRAYAENKIGIGYSASNQFITLALPKVETKEITDIQLTSVVLNGAALFDGNDSTTVYGFCWSRESMPTIENEHIEVLKDTFIYPLTNLVDETKYYVRAYAKNKIGIVYGEEKEFKTASTTLAIVETIEASDITYTSAKVGGRVISDGGSEVIERGMCYSITKNPTIENNIVKIDENLDSFIVDLSELKDGVTYYVRAYAKNKKGIAYGKQVELTTKAYGVPVVKTLEVTNISFSSAKVGGNIIADGGLAIIERGVCYSITKNPTTENDIVKIEESLDSFIVDLSKLKDGVTYYVRAYAKNKKGVAYGEQVEFTTKAYGVPIVEIIGVVNIMDVAARVEAKVISDGGLDIMEQGVCYSINENPTIENGIVLLDEELSSSFFINLVDLIPGTKYYVRAYAKNDKGIAYGSQVSFVTLVYDLPIIETLEAMNISYTSATVGGNVVSDGNMIITQRGICYSNTENPTIENSIVVLDKDSRDFDFFTIELDSLIPGAKYYVCAYAINGKGVSYGENISFVTKDYIEGDHRYVDLGLSVMWATCNIGAESPEEYGDYFAWGEVEPKEVYSWSTYKYGIEYGLLKYCNDAYYGKDGFVDNKMELEAEDDAAIVNWGGLWRIPTKAEQEELINNCTWTSETRNGVYGYKVKGVNGNSIFLPKTGWMYGGVLSNVGSNGYYWSSSLYADNLNSSYSILNNKISSRNRYFGLTIRPVLGQKLYTISVGSSDNSQGTVSGGGIYEDGYQITLIATANSGYKFKEWNDGNTDNPRVITVTSNAIYTAYFEEENNLHAGHEYVDLGLSVKWATCNVGANSPEEYGNYYAWGEVESNTVYSWSTYKYWEEKTLTKYCTESSMGKDGFVDNKSILDPEDDVATMNWGGSWRMATKAEQDELYNSCTWNWTTQNGVNGYKVTGLNGNSIFLPAAGYMYDGVLSNDGSGGYYWSSSLYGFPYFAYFVKFYSSSVDCSEFYDRYYGRSVRPVYK